MMGEKLHISRKIIKIVLMICVILQAAIISVYAWLFSINRLTRTEALQVDMPPIIYIKNDNLEEVTSFHLDGLKIGEEYNEVFCISPALVGSVEDFFLGVIYTENLGMNIQIYPVSFVTDTDPGESVLSEARNVLYGESETETTCYFQYSKKWPEGSDIRVTYGGWTEPSKPEYANLNYGVYKAYRNLKFTKVQGTPATLLETMNDTSRYRFFILNITWNEDTGVENAKEADIVYIVTKGTKAES